MHPDSSIPMRIALAQRNLHKGEDYLMDVSDPLSANYGKHWTIEKIAETFAPSSDTVDAVSKWLSEAGIEFKRSKGLNWIDATVSVEQAESLLKTKYFEYTHESGKTHVACEGYSLPEDLVQHIDFVTPTTHFDVKVPRIDKRQATVDNTVNAKSIGQPGTGVSFPKTKGAFSLSNIINELEQCDTVSRSYHV